jgi:peptide/nickel transport system substrate-binding protein
MSTSGNRRQFLLGTAAAAASAPFLFRGRPVLAADHDQVVIRLDTDIGNLDPANRTGSTEDDILFAVCQNLARFDPNALDWSPDAAKTIKQVSDTEIDFELNPGQMFHGGYGEMTADDVKFSFERFTQTDAEGNKAAYADDFSALDHVEVTGKYTGKLVLKNPAPALWVIGICDGSGAILSKKACDALGDKIRTQLIGSGPYMFKDWKPKEQFVLEANPDYKGRDTPHFKQVVGRIVTEPKTALLAYLANELALTEVDPTSEDEAKKNPDGVIKKIPGIDYQWIGINVEKPPLDDLKVRQAIRYAIDVDAIIAGAYDNTVPRANNLLAPGLLGYWKDSPVYKHDPEKAKALLAETGQSNLSLTFTSLNDATSQAIAQIAQANLAEVGINLTLKPLDSGAYWAMGDHDASKDLELTLIPYSSKFDPSFQTQWFLSDQVGVWNWQRWKSPEFDKLHKEAASILDKAEREKKYIRMQQLLDESASCIWITHGVHVFGHAKWLKPAWVPNGINLQIRFYDKA